MSARAKRIAEDPSKLKTISEGAKQWLNQFAGTPLLGDTAADLCDMIDLLNDYADGVYREVPKRLLVAMVAAVLYVISPIDLLPGFIDDVLVVSVIMDHGVRAEVKKYKEWKGA